MSGADVAPILWFSRGRGRGHAIPDAMIADELRRLAPKVRLTFASYATGATTLRGLQQPVIDLNLPDEPSLPRLMLAASQALERYDATPIVVVSHEEFAAVAVAKKRGHTPVVYMADWLPPPQTFEARCVESAERLLLLDWAAHCPCPEYMRPRARYTGPIFGLTTETTAREAARCWLGVLASTKVVLLAPGSTSSHSEQVSPLLDLFLESWDRVSTADKRAFWLADSREAAILLGHPRAAEINILPPQRRLVDVMAACDLVITKGNRITTLEAAFMGIPSMSITYQVNPIDDRRIAVIADHVRLEARTATPARVAAQIAEGLARGLRSPSGVTGDPRASARAAALLILECASTT